MRWCDSGPSIFDNDSWSTDTPAIACNMNGTMVMIDVDANEFAKASSSSELAKVCDKLSGIPREANDGAIDIHHKCMRAVYLCAST
jgi:hypothetical protein